MLSLRQLSSRLTQYDGNEACSIVRLLLYELFGFSYTDICCGELDRLSQEQSLLMDACMDRLVAGEPVQYVVGRAEFMGRTFHVAPGVLIPRPETEELCEWVISDSQRYGGQVRVLDIGTGSGCIAVSLALAIASSDVEAWDISETALQQASDNARSLSANVSFRKVDILDDTAVGKELQQWDVIVSNPPYICDKEKSDMENNVLDYEPHLALFVPDDDPLLFYRAIARYASESLTPDGCLYYEINPLYCDEMEKMLEEYGFTDVCVRADEYGKQRMMRCSRRM